MIIDLFHRPPWSGAELAKFTALHTARKADPRSVPPVPPVS